MKELHLYFYLYFCFIRFYNELRQSLILFGIYEVIEMYGNSLKHVKLLQSFPLNVK